jgi:hypothetical protein
MRLAHNSPMPVILITFLFYKNLMRHLFQLCFYLAWSGWWHTSVPLQTWLYILVSRDSLSQPVCLEAVLVLLGMRRLFPNTTYTCYQYRQTSDPMIILTCFRHNNNNNCNFEELTISYTLLLICKLQGCLPYGIMSILVWRWSKYVNNIPAPLSQTLYCLS